MEKFKINLIEDSDSYFAALGISQERANQLMESAKDLMSEYTDMSIAMKNGAEMCNTVEELIFIQFKMGELLGVLRSADEPSQARAFAAKIRLRMILKQFKNEGIHREDS